MLTDVGPVEIVVPRDRDGSFEPKIVKKRLTGVDEMVISLAAAVVGAMLGRKRAEKRVLRAAAGESVDDYRR